jgi:hypothetical protein
MLFDRMVVVVSVGYIGESTVCRDFGGRKPINDLRKCEKGQVRGEHIVDCAREQLVMLRVVGPVGSPSRKGFTRKLFQSSGDGDDWIGFW